MEGTRTLIVESLLVTYPNGFTTAELTQVITTAMALVGATKNLSGLEKKQLVIDVINDLVDRTVFYDNRLDDIIKLVVPNLIDTLVSVDNGQIVINPKTKSMCMSCF